VLVGTSVLANVHLVDAHQGGDTAVYATYGGDIVVAGKNWFNFGELALTSKGALTMRIINTAGEVVFERTLTRRKTITPRTSGGRITRVLATV